MQLQTRRVARLAAALLFAAASVSCQTMSFPDGAASAAAENGTERGGNRNGKNLFGWLGTFADEDADPYLASANGACLQGDMTECFKARALSGLGDFFVRDSYRLNENVRVVRLSGGGGGDDDGEGRSSRASFEFSTEQRPDDSEWDRLVKFAMRKVERFLRSAAVEVHVPDELTEGGRYSPRFIDEISSELDTLEDKKASIITKKKVKKLLVPLLIVLKLFKLKLLLFLPLILGLASFKKFLGFMALIVPGLIGFFKLCKPDLQHNYGTYGHSSFYNRPSGHHQAGGALPLGSAYAPYRGEHVLQQESPYREHPDAAQQYLFESQERPSFGQPYNNGAGPTRDLLQQEPSNLQPGFRTLSSSSSGSVSFKDDANDMAYKGYNGGSHK